MVSCDETPKPSLPHIKIVDSSVRNPEYSLVGIKINQQVKLLLEENTATGYTWNILNSDNMNQRQVVSLDGDAYEEPSESETEMLGVPGKRAYTFKGLKSGLQAVDMVYMHPWELE